MSNWDKADHDSMWIPSRPNASGGDRYNKRKRKENSTPHQRHRHYNHSSYNNNHNNHNTNHYNNNYRPNAYNDTKRVIIAKKKNHSSNRDINDSFVNSSKLDAKRQREHQQYLMQQHANSKEAKMADYKHKQQRYSQIKNEFGLNTTNNTNKTSGNHAQTRTIQNTQNTYNKPNGSNREKPKFKVLQRDNGRGTKLAILDLAGDMNDQQLYAELDKKSKSSMPLKPIRPPIRTQRLSQSLRLTTPTRSVPKTKQSPKYNGRQPIYNQSTSSDATHSYASIVKISPKYSGHKPIHNQSSYQPQHRIIPSHRIACVSKSRIKAQTEAKSVQSQNRGYSDSFNVVTRKAIKNKGTQRKAINVLYAIHKSYRLRKASNITKYDRMCKNNTFWNMEGVETAITDAMIDCVFAKCVSDGMNAKYISPQELIQYLPSSFEINRHKHIKKHHGGQWEIWNRNIHCYLGFQVVSTDYDVKHLLKELYRRKAEQYRQSHHIHAEDCGDYKCTACCYVAPFKRYDQQQITNDTEITPHRSDLCEARDIWGDCQQPFVQPSDISQALWDLYEVSSEWTMNETGDGFYCSFSMPIVLDPTQKQCKLTIKPFVNCVTVNYKGKADNSRYEKHDDILRSFNRSQEYGNPPPPPKKIVVCLKCNEEGHIARQCPLKPDKRRSAKKCYRCGESGHLVRDCGLPNNDKCNRCGEIGHWARDCVARDDYRNGTMSM
eukprot:82219_1